MTCQLQNLTVEYADLLLDAVPGSSIGLTTAIRSGRPSKFGTADYETEVLKDTTDLILQHHA